MRVTERDIELLLWLNGFGFVLVSQIAKWMGVDFSTAARRVRALVEAGLVRRVKSSILSATPIIVTPKGAQVAGDSLPPLSGIRPGEFRHDAVLVDVARGLTARFPGSHFEPVRRIRHSGALAEAKHLPDGYVHRGADRYIVELELTVKSRKRLEAIMLRERVDALRLQRIEHETAIAQLGRRKSINPIVLDPAKLGQFSDSIKSRLRSADPAFRRQWLRLFVGEVRIGPEQIRIKGPNDAICELIERHDKMGAMVPNFAREWRARRDSNSRPSESKSDALSS